MATGRNEPCPCGSGLKYKNCCEGKRRTSKGMLALLFVIAMIAGAGGMAAFMGRDKPPAPRPTPQNPQAGRPQPGPAPPGKVWSAEHGHWHDIGATTPVNPIEIKQTSGVPLTPTVSGNTPQPSGPVPPGKVWSTEHGHWHDVAPQPATK